MVAYSNIVVAGGGVIGYVKYYCLCRLRICIKKYVISFANWIASTASVLFCCSNSISYYLAKRYSLPCTIIDCVGIAPAASGKAGGFLAKDWSDGSPIQDLQRRSFDLHAEQAEHLGASNIDYRRLKCLAVACDERGGGAKPSSKKLEGVEWADLSILGHRVMGETDTIAQVC